jgi:hypothetical protein
MEIQQSAVFFRPLAGRARDYPLPARCCGQHEKTDTSIPSCVRTARVDCSSLIQGGKEGNTKKVFPVTQKTHKHSKTSDKTASKKYDKCKFPAVKKVTLALRENKLHITLQFIIFQLFIRNIVQFCSYVVGSDVSNAAATTHTRAQNNRLATPCLFSPNINMNRIIVLCFPCEAFSPWSLYLWRHKL